ncbi:autotransporter outer membrane beta-barrel domain-containing protein [Escherichia coli]
MVLNNNGFLFMNTKKTQLSVIIASLLFTPLTFAASVTSVKANEGDHVVMVDDVVNSNDGGNAVDADGKNASIDTNGREIISSGDRTSAVKAGNGGTVNVNNSKIFVYGNHSRGISAGANSQVNVNESAITVKRDDGTGTDTGTDSVGVFAEGILKIQKSKIITEQNNGHAAVISGNGVLDLQDSSLISKHNSALNITGQNAEVLLKNSTAKGNNAAIIVNGQSAGRVHLMKSTISSDKGILADAGQNSGLEIDASGQSALSGITVVPTGSTLNMRLSDNSTWVSGGDSAVTNLSLDKSTLVISGTDARKNVGNIVTVTGDYLGNNGTVVFNTVLGDDNSSTDKLVVQGNTRGKTFVTVNRIGGSGAQTLNGIELIHVDGQSDGEFIQKGRITAGAYDYRLGRGSGDSSGNWYLTSGKNTLGLTPNQELPPDRLDNDIRPEAGSYTANIAAANRMFIMRLAERPGIVSQPGIEDSERNGTSLWIRHKGEHNRWHDSSGQLRTQGNRYVLQMGGDLAQWSRNGDDSWHLGIMAGYGSDNNSTESARTGYHSKGSVKGYTTGLYGTWYEDETHKGAYVDAWAGYSWFDNYIKGYGLSGESWKSNGFTASLETGYVWKAGEFTGSKGSLNEWYVQPQTQVIWMGVKADKYRESNGTHVESLGDGNFLTRLGVKTWIKSHHKMDEGKFRDFSPFIEVNWLHNTHDFGTRMNGVMVHQAGTRNTGEVKTGVLGQINPHLNLWGDVGVQTGDKGYNAISATLGLKYIF